MPGSSEGFIKEIHGEERRRDQSRIYKDGQVDSKKPDQDAGQKWNKGEEESPRHAKSQKPEEERQPRRLLNSVRGSGD